MPSLSKDLQLLVPGRYLRLDQEGPKYLNLISMNFYLTIGGKDRKSSK